MVGYDNQVLFYANHLDLHKSVFYCNNLFSALSVSLQKEVTQPMSPHPRTLKCIFSSFMLMDHLYFILSSALSLKSQGIFSLSQRETDTLFTATSFQVVV